MFFKFAFAQPGKYLKHSVHALTTNHIDHFEIIKRIERIAAMNKYHMTYIYKIDLCIVCEEFENRSTDVGKLP